MYVWNQNWTYDMIDIRRLGCYFSLYDWLCHLATFIKVLGGQVTKPTIFVSCGTSADIKVFGHIYPLQSNWTIPCDI